MLTLPIILLGIPQLILLFILMHPQKDGVQLLMMSPVGDRSSEEAKSHINYLELSAALFALKCFVHEVSVMSKL